MNRCVYCRSGRNDEVRQTTKGLTYGKVTVFGKVPWHIQGVFVDGIVLSEVEWCGSVEMASIEDESN
jgi:hypothetical protein